MAKRKKRNQPETAPPTDGAAESAVPEAAAEGVTDGAPAEEAARAEQVADTQQTADVAAPVAPEAEGAAPDGPVPDDDTAGVVTDAIEGERTLEVEGAVADVIPFEADRTVEVQGGDPDAEGEPIAEALEGNRLEHIIESLLFAADKSLSLGDLKRLLGERDGKKVEAAVEALGERRKGTGIEVVSVAGGWTLRTNAEHHNWVGKLLSGRPVRLSRAMLETMAIVAYRQPVTRPEIDEIRGVDCGPVLKTLLDRGLIRVIGKKEEVGRPMLYGTTPEFLRTFNLRDLSELPTLREFHELSDEDRSKVDAAAPPSEAAPAAPVANPFTPHPGLPPDVSEDNDALVEELERATQAASRAVGSATEPPTPGN